MLISKVENNNPNFGAKFYHYPNAYNHPDIAKGFEEATKEYPDMVLLQDYISYFDNDQFYLLKKGEVLGFDTMALTKYRHYFSNDDIVDKLVGLFHKMLGNKVK